MAALRRAFTVSRPTLLGRRGLPLLAPPLAPPPALHLSFWQVNRAALRRALAYIPRCLTRQMWLPPPQRAPPLALSLLASPALVGQVRGSRCCAPSLASHLALLGIRCGRSRCRSRRRSRFRCSRHLPYLAGVRVVLRRTLTLSHTLPYLAGVVAAAAAGVPPCPTRQVWSLPLLLAPPLAPPLVASWLQRLAPPCALSPLASLAPFGRLEGRAAARLHLIPPCLTRQARLPQLAPPSLALSRSLLLPYSAG